MSLAHMQRFLELVGHFKHNKNTEDNRTVDKTDALAFQDCDCFSQAYFS